MKKITFLILFCVICFKFNLAYIDKEVLSKEEMKINYLLALESYERGNYGTAKDLLEKNYLSGDKRSYILFLLGKIYKLEPFFDIEKSIKFFEKYIETVMDKKQKNIGRLQLAYIYKDLDLNKAKQYVDLIIKEMPNDPDMRFCYAVIYNRIGLDYYIKAQYINALNCFEDVINKRKDFQEAYNNLIVTLFRIIENTKDQETKLKYCNKINDYLKKNKKINDKNTKLLSLISYYEKICK